jgi:hypothetical protein
MPIDTQQVDSLHARIDTLAARFDQRDETIRLEIDLAISRTRAQIAIWIAIVVLILQTGILVAIILAVFA